MRGKNRPIFIVGSGRSGTSVLTWCLGQHPNILPLPETHWIARLTVNMRQFYKFGTVHGRYSHLGALDWNEIDFYAAFGKAVDQFIIDTREPRLRFIRKLSSKSYGLDGSETYRLEQKGQLSPDPDLVTATNYQIVRSPCDPKDRWVDGTPENTFYMYSLSLLFPNACFIHLLRDPNEVAKSFMCFSQAGKGGVDYDEAQAYSHWHRNVEYAVKGEKAFGKEKVLRINYAELVNSQEATVRSCLEFIGERLTIDCLRPMQERINSSKMDKPSSPLKPSTPEGKEANEFYRTILDVPPGNPDKRALHELVQHFENYAAQINV